MVFGGEEIGFLTVLAVSGSVMLFVLSRQKLLESNILRELCARQRENGVNFHSVESSILQDLCTKQRENGVNCRRSCLADADSSSFSPAGKIRTSAKKKVHFAEDVVEPSGEGEKYRKHRTCAAEVNTEVGGSNPGRLARAATSASVIEADDYSSKEICGARGTLAGPKIPANRLALYRGILQYRSQRAASIY